MKRQRVVLRQSRIEGGRLPVSGGLEPAVEKRVQQTLSRFAITRPMLISLALADFLAVEIDDQERTGIRRAK
jgi:hypothetical protein